MNKTVLIVAALAAFVFPLTSFADDGRFYIKGNVGIGIAMDSDIDDLPETATLTYDNGPMISIAGGYDFAKPMRIEMEILRQKNNLDSLSYDDSSDDFSEGDLRSKSLMLNGFYDVNTGSSWTPFVGAGIGWSLLSIDATEYDTPDNDGAFTYQFIGGVAYAINDRWSVDAQYRFIGINDAYFDGADFDFHSNNLMLGVRYSF